MSGEIKYPPVVAQRTYAACGGWLFSVEFVKHERGGEGRSRNRGMMAANRACLCVMLPRLNTVMHSGNSKVR